MSVLALRTMVAAACSPLGGGFNLNNPTFFVSNTGSDSNSGKSSLLPWLTVAHVNAQTLAPGNVVAFKRGGIWRETLTVPNAGTASLPVGFTVYGSGALPRVTGFDLATGWTLEAEPAAVNFTTTSPGPPISWWMFEDAASPSLDGNTTNANNLTYTGNAAQSAVHVQGSFSLGGTTGNASRSLANLSANFPFKAATTQYTIGAWIFLKANAPTFNNTMSMGNLSTTGAFFGGSGTIGKPRLRTFSGGTGNNIDADGVYTADGWHHLVMRWIGNAGFGTANEVSFWIDGVKQTSTNVLTSVSLDTTSGLAFVFSATVATNYDEAFAFAVALTDAQIFSIFANRLDGSAGPAFNAYFFTPAVQPLVTASDGVMLPIVASKLVGVLTPGTSFWDGTHIYVRLSGDDAPSGHTLEVAHRNSPVTCPFGFITLDNLQVDGGNTKTQGMIWFDFASAPADRVTIQNCVVQNGGGDGINLGFASLFALTNVLITNCAVSTVGRHGIYFNLTDGVLGQENYVTANTVSNAGFDPLIVGACEGITVRGNYCIVQNNTVPHAGNTAQPGGSLHAFSGSIGEGTGDHNIWRYNICDGTVGKSPDGYGISIDQWCDNNVVHHNVIYNTQGPGIYFFDAANGQCYNNTCYNTCTAAPITNNQPGAIRLIGSATSLTANTIVENNIGVVTVVNAIAVWVGPTTTLQAQTIKNNCWQHTTAGSNWWLFNATRGNTLAAWLANSGTVAISGDINADPLFVAAGSANFALQNGSPCLGTGLVIPGITVGATPNIGAL